MAYIRGENYVWRDDDSMHFWATAAPKDNGVTDADKKNPDYPHAVQVPISVIDAVVIMRFAQLLVDPEINLAWLIETVSEHNKGNAGAGALLETQKALIDFVEGY